MIDYDYVECTSSSIQALCKFREYYPQHRRAEVDMTIDQGSRSGWTCEIDSVMTSADGAMCRLAVGSCKASSVQTARGKACGVSASLTALGKHLRVSDITSGF